MIDLFFALIFSTSALALLAGLLFLLRSLQPGGRGEVRLPPDGGIGVTVAAGFFSVVLVLVTVAYLSQHSPPPTTPYVIKLTAYQFGWRFEYFEVVPSPRDRRNGPPPLRSLGVSTTDHLVLPGGVDTGIWATSSDVIHRLELPDFQVRKDLIPGLVSDFRLHPPRNGRFVLLSDGLCGASLGLMAARVTVVDLAVFRPWLTGRRVPSEGVSAELPVVRQE